MLYVVATPIGNLQDMSPHAIDVLKNVALIAAEDTRVTRKLTSYFHIDTPLTSYHQHNEQNKSDIIVERMLREGIDVALVTDAGTPSISDPGSFLVHHVIGAGLPVVAVAGPSALAAALSVSGFDFCEFSFYGFLPRNPSDLKKKLINISQHAKVAVFHESPHRVIDLMKAVSEVLPQADLSISCDLTKLFEKTLHGKPEELLIALEANPKTEKGEYCICMNMINVPHVSGKIVTQVSIEARLFDLILKGWDMKSAIAEVVADGEKKNTVYAASLRVKEMII